MRILYVGDIMGKPGRNVIKSVLPKFRQENKVDLVIAQCENVSHGKGMTPTHMRDLQQAGVDVFSGGNHTVEKEALDKYLDDPNEPVIRPANMDKSIPGKGFYIADVGGKKVLVASILGETFPKSHYEGHPLETIDKIFEENDFDFSVVNFHGDFSSQKRIFGYYLDGRATAVIGDHWHVPTADAMILPGGTSHISDVGMCGTVHTSLGIDMQGAIDSWKDPSARRADIVDIAPYQFNAVLIEANNKGLSDSIKPINLIVEQV